MHHPLNMASPVKNPVCACTPGMSVSCVPALESIHFMPTLQCENFVFGGCLGNANNFLTLEACTAACLPPAPGPDSVEVTPLKTAHSTASDTDAVLNETATTRAVAALIVEAAEVAVQRANSASSLPQVLQQPAQQRADSTSRDDQGEAVSLADRNMSKLDSILDPASPEQIAARSAPAGPPLPAQSPPNYPTPTLAPATEAGGGASPRMSPAQLPAPPAARLLVPTNAGLAVRAGWTHALLAGCVMIGLIGLA